MRFSQAWTVARHELRTVRRSRAIMAALIGFPLGVGVGFPALLEYVIATTGTEGFGSWFPGIVNAFSFWFVIGAVSLPTSIASYSIVGEKTSKSLESLLLTPTSDGEILMGKALGAFLPTVVAVWIGATVFQVLVDLESRANLGYWLFPNLEMTVAIFVLMPLSVLFTIEACVVISARVSDVRAAQQAGGVLVMPFVIVYVASIVTLGLDAEVLLLISGMVAPCVVALYFLSLKTFRRDQILTQWK